MTGSRFDRAPRVARTSATGGAGEQGEGADFLTPPRLAAHKTKKERFKGGFYRCPMSTCPQGACGGVERPALPRGAGARSPCKLGLDEEAAGADEAAAGAVDGVDEGGVSGVDEVGIGVAAGGEDGVVEADEEEVGIGSLINSLGKHCGVENHRIDFCEKCIHFLFFAKRKIFLGESLHSLGEKLLRESGSELVHAVVVVQTIGKPDLLEIFFESYKFGVVFVPFIVGIYSLDSLSDYQIVFSVLVPQNITTIESGFGEIVDVFFLLKRQIVETGHFVAKHLNVGEVIDMVVEIFLGICHS